MFFCLITDIRSDISELSSIWEDSCGFSHTPKKKSYELVSLEMMKNYSHAYSLAIKARVKMIAKCYNYFLKRCFNALFHWDLIIS